MEDLVGILHRLHRYTLDDRCKWLQAERLSHDFITDASHERILPPRLNEGVSPTATSFYGHRFIAMNQFAQLS